MENNEDKKTLEEQIEECNQGMESLAGLIDTNPTTWQQIKYYLTWWLPVTRRELGVFNQSMVELSYGFLECKRSIYQIAVVVRQMQKGKSKGKKSSGGMYQ